ncbi:MAG TPA: MDR family MFS transporter [Stellaceae bacterium]|nr:MDR family MFS transporter [Stellaceae bacterium]
MSSAGPTDYSAPNFTHRETLIILSGVMIGMFLAALDQTIVATALPRIAGDLHGGEHISWVVSGYLLTSTASTPIYGKLSDLYGRKVMLQTALIIFLLTSILCGLAQSMPQLIAARALQGLGGGGLLAMAHATIADVVAPRERGRYQGYFGSMFATSSIIGPILGGLFADHLTWRWVFWINLPIGLIGLALSAVALKKLKAKRLRHKIDYAGAVLLVSAVTCVLFVTTMGGNEYAWDSSMILSLMLAAGLLLAIFIWHERRIDEPVLPPRLFQNAVFRIANVANLLSSICMLGSIVFLPLYLELVHGLSASDSGLMLIPLTGATVFGAIGTGQVVARIGRYKIFPITGLTLNVLGSLLLAMLPPDASLYAVAIGMLVTGVGIGMVMPVIMVAVQNAVSSRDIGTATSSISFFRSMGGAFGVALFGAVLIAGLDSLLAAVPGHEALGPTPGLALLHAGPDAISGTPALLRAAVTHAMSIAFRNMFLVAAGISMVALGFALFLKELPLRSSRDSTLGEAGGALAGSASLAE